MAKVTKRGYIPYLIFALCASLYFLPFMRLLLQETDEGILVYGAVRIVHGQVFARDFFEVVGPEMCIRDRMRTAHCAMGR